MEAERQDLGSVGLIPLLSLFSHLEDEGAGLGCFRDLKDPP